LIDEHEGTRDDLEHEGTRNDLDLAIAEFKLCDFYIQAAPLIVPDSTSDEEFEVEIVRTLWDLAEKSWEVYKATHPGKYLEFSLEDLKTYLRENGELQNLKRKKRRSLQDPKNEIRFPCGHNT